MVNAECRTLNDVVGSPMAFRVPASVFSIPTFSFQIH